MKTSRPVRNLTLPIALVIVVLMASTVGYMLIEHMTPVDALYEATTMMTTVGDATFQLSHPGRIFSIFVMLLGVSALLYTFGAVAEYVVEGHLSLAVRRRRMDNKIAALRGHYIVCGFGRVGLQIAEDLAEVRESFVVVDERPDSARRAMDSGYLTIEGDGTNDDVLRNARIEDARCLLVATDNDAHNISITLSARHLSPGVFIVARANHDETAVKLKLAGANQVISPYMIAGHKMTELARHSEGETQPARV